MFFPNLSVIHQLHTFKPEHVIPSMLKEFKNPNYDLKKILIRAKNEELPIFHDIEHRQNIVLQLWTTKKLL